MTRLPKVIAGVICVVCLWGVPASAQDGEVTIKVFPQRGTDHYLVTFSRPLENLSAGTKSSIRSLVEGLKKHPTVIKPDSVEVDAEGQLLLAKQSFENNGHRYVEECEFARVLLAEIKANINPCREIKWGSKYNPCGWPHKVWKKPEPCNQPGESPASSKSRREHWYDWPQFPFGVRGYNNPGRLLFAQKEKD